MKTLFVSIVLASIMGTVHIRAEMYAKELSGL